jgi:hypothetical protein
VRKRVTKSRPIIALEDVPARFDDDCIRKLASELPPGADLNALGWWIKEAASIFANDARIPTANQLHAEIAILCDAARRRLFEQVADLLDKLSLEARAMLSTLGALPAPSDLRGEALRDEACDAVASLCRIGGELVEGRNRPCGKQSRPLLRPLLYAPKPRRHFPRRDAELRFVARLSNAWRDVTGKKPSRTARHGDASRDVGPFARFVGECLRLVGAGDADAVELINQLHRGRRIRKRRTVKRRPE